MRISDWSSDVCSSDLQINNKRCSATRNRTGRAGRQRQGSSWQIEVEASNRGPQPKRLILDPIAWRGLALTLRPAMLAGHRARRRAVPERKNRSEEHTSELQSLMRISYAVVCLKKQKT